MALRVWLPLNGDLNNQGLSNLIFINESASNLVVDNNGKIGKCYSRPTKQTTGRIISDKTINLDNNFTMCCWANVSDGIASANGLVSNHDHSSNTGVGINVKYISSTDFRISCSTGTGTGRTYESYYGTTNIKDTWHHLALTYDKTAKQLLLYVDGVVEYTLNNYLNASKEDYVMLFEWSTNYNNTNYRPAAKLNDVRIYDECLSPKQIKEISKGLIAHYKLDNPYIEATENLVPSNIYNYTSVPNAYYSGVRNIVSFQGETCFSVTTVSNSYPDGFICQQTAACTENGVYTYSGYIWIPAGYTWSVGMRMINGGGGYFHQQIVGNNEWQYFSYTFTANNNTSGMIQGYEAQNYDTVHTIYLKKLQLEKKDHATPFAAGARNGQSYESDCSGNGYNLKKVGTQTFNTNTPRYSGCNIFDANTSYFKLLISTTSGFANSFTIIYWAKITDMNGKMAWGFGDGNRLNIYPSSSVFCCNTGDGSNNQYKNNGTAVAFAPYNNAWHQYAMVGDGTTNKLYIDGVYAGTATTYKGITGSQLYISGWDTGTSYKWTNGSISDFRIYATALSANDILTMYKNSGIIDNKGNVYAYEFKEE